MRKLVALVVFVITFMELEAQGTPCEVGGRNGTCVPQEVCININEGSIDILGSERETNCTSRQHFIEDRSGCGWRNPEGVGFLFVNEDNVVKYGEFPWITALLSVETSDNNSTPNLVYIGAGSLIHRSVVLTTAHLVAKANTIRVRAGEWDTQTDTELYPHQERDVSEVKIHEDYSPRTLFYDVAVLFLARPMDLAPNVALACLPQPRQKPLPDTRCFASGWDKDKFGKTGRYKVILEKVEVPVVDRRTCLNQLRKTRLGGLFELHHTFMCAGGEPGKDTCKGDGGSPLVCPMEFQDGRYVQHGIVAWGIGCGADGTPGVYVDVGVVRDWIDNQVAGRGYEPNDYSKY